MSKIISIIIPSFNEDSNLNKLFEELISVIDCLNNYIFEIIIVENGSTDQSLKILKELNSKDKRLKILQLSRNFVPNNAIIAGLKFSRGDAAIIMPADLQEPTEIIPVFVEYWEKGYDEVYGIIKKRSKESFIRRQLYSLFYRIINYLTEDLIPKNAGDFRLIDRKIIDVLINLKEVNKFLRGLIPWIGFTHIGVPYERRERYAGESKADWYTVIKLAFTGIVSFSNVPLYISSLLGFVMSFLSILYIIYQIYLFVIFGREIPGIATITFILLLSFGTLFLLLGIIGIYIGQLLDEIRDRPDYVIKEKIGFDNL